MELYGPEYGYIPNASKSTLVVPEERLDATREYFNNAFGLNFKFSSGERYLGGFIGLPKKRDAFVEEKVSGWVFGIERLVMVATNHYPQAAYSSLSKFFQHQWTYVQRVIPGIGHFF